MKKTFCIVAAIAAVLFVVCLSSCGKGESHSLNGTEWGGVESGNDWTETYVLKFHKNTFTMVITSYDFDGTEEDKVSGDYVYDHPIVTLSFVNLENVPVALNGTVTGDKMTFPGMVLTKN